MGFFNRKLGFRWSLYVVQNENELLYAMHENAVLRMVGYVMGYFAEGGKPIHPWSLHLNFNHSHQTIKLGPEHFTPDGENLTPTLIHKIAAIDPGWQVGDGEPVFEEVATKKQIKISEYPPGQLDIQAMFDNMHKPRELTFYRVMDEVFGRRH